MTPTEKRVTLEMKKPSLTIYTNGKIDVPGASPRLRIVALNQDGSEERLLIRAKRVRVYDYTDPENQVSKDFYIPSHVGSGSEWITNEALAEAIRLAFPAENGEIK